MRGVLPDALRVSVRAMMKPGGSLSAAGPVPGFAQRALHPGYETIRSACGLQTTCVDGDRYCVRSCRTHHVLGPHGVGSQKRRAQGAPFCLYHPTKTARQLGSRRE